MVQHSDLDHSGVTGVPGANPQFTTIELGHASDTTIARASAGNLTVEGNAIYRAGGTDVALADGGTGVSLTDPNADRILFWDDSAGQFTWLTVGTNLTITGTTIDAASGSSSGLLGVKYYNPSGNNTYVISTTSDADVDGTNLTVTFTAPASGNVICKWSAFNNDSTSGNCNFHWTVRESSSTLADDYISSGLAKAVRSTATFYISGISAGSHTYKFGAYQASGTNATIYYGTTAPFGPVIMEVYAAP